MSIKKIFVILHFVSKNLVDKTGEIVDKFANTNNSLSTSENKKSKQNETLFFLSMKKTYTQPKLEVMDVAVELGFAQTNVESPGYGGEIQPALELD